jgi:hypothetical protein
MSLRNKKIEAIGQLSRTAKGPVAATSPMHEFEFNPRIRDFLISHRFQIVPFSYLDHQHQRFENTHR